VKRLFHFGVLVAMAIGHGCAAEPPPEDPDPRIRRVENGLRPFKLDGGIPRRTGGPKTIAKRMRHHRVPGVSIAVIDRYEIAWAKGYGVVESGGDRPVTPETLFQAASIGKPLTAVAAIRFVELGLLDPDRNVNEVLTSWKVPENRFTSNEKVSLRRLLSHSAGVSVHGFRGYGRGNDLPTLRQILDGKPPANNEPIRVTSTPGSEWRYSGGGFMIVQQVLEDLTGDPFPAIMQEIVLRPAGMESSVYAAPLPAHRNSDAATAHDERGRPAQGKWYDLVCMGAGGGLWTTPSDLARFAIEIMRARKGQSEVFSKGAADLMLTPRIALNEDFDMGLGFMLRDENGELSMMHGGGNQPGFLSLLVAMPDRGQGVVIMTNGQNGHELATEIVFSVIDEYRWPESDS
jgi:CubicO group peptidase (beta-lactamase class C family)